MGKKSLTGNLILSGIRSVLTILFPFITYKYAAIMLGVDSIGHVECAKSIVSYFILLAGLGITTYATRNSAAIRDNREKLQHFVEIIFGINCISTVISVILLILILNLILSLRSEYGLILVFSSEIILATLGVEWLYIAFEDFKYITIRTVLCQIIAIIFMLLFVRTETDAIWYAITIVISSYGANIFGFFYARRYCKIRPRFSKESIATLPAILVLFANSIAVTVYVNSDITMLGIFSGTYEVGIYSAAVKIYTAAKTVIAAVLNVLLPRFTFYYYNKEKNKYKDSESFVIYALVALVFPFSTVLIGESSNLLILISGTEYLAATPAMIVLATALCFSTVGMLIGSTILLPQKKEKMILKSTIIGALLNISLNFILLPKISFLGAAITTLISEFVVGCIQLISAKNVLNELNYRIKEFVGPICGAILIYLVCKFVNLLQIGSIWQLFISAIACMVVYSVVLVCFKNQFMFFVLHKVRKLILRRSK